MPTPIATAAFVREVRAFSTRTPDWSNAIRYYTKPDERADITLIAARVYGSRTEYMAIFAAAGLDSLELLIPEQLLVLPTPEQLMLIKRQTGYLTNEEKRAYEALN